MDTQKKHILEELFQNNDVLTDLGIEDKLNTLDRVFSKVRKGSKEVVLINGEIGTGKTWLFEYWHQNLKSQNFELIEGKFELFSKNVPYLPWTSAFFDWVKNISQREEKEIYRLRQSILNDVGQSGQVLIDWIPFLEELIGEQPEIQVLDNAEKTKHRFYFVLKTLIRNLARKQKPLILFLNDWQWADQASLEFLKVILEDELTQYMMIVLGHRAEKIEEDHPFYLYLQQAKGGLRAETNIKQIAMANLSHEKVVSLFNTYLTKYKTTDLASNFAGQTKGNLLFVSLGIEYLINEETPITEKLKALQDSDLNKIIYIKFIQLSQNTQELLTVASCWGNVFDILTIAKVINKTEEEIEAFVKEATLQNFIDSVDDRNQDNWLFRFKHSLFQEGIYENSPKDIAKQYHKSLAKIDLASSLTANNKILLLLQANQFLVGDVPIADIETIGIKVLLLAGKTSYAMAAFEIALRYIEKGIEAQKDDAWEKEKDIAYALHYYACELSYMLDADTQAEKYLDIILQKSTRLVHKVKAQELKINYLKKIKDSKQTAELSLKVLAQLGITFPKNPSLFNQTRDSWQFRIFLSNKRVEDFAFQQAVEDEAMEVAQRLLLTSRNAILKKEPKLSPFLAIAQVRLAIKYSHPAYAPLGYANYAKYLLKEFNDVEKALTYGQVAQKMIDRVPDMRTLARTLFLLNVYIRPWQDPLIKTITPLNQAHQIAYEVGDLSFVAHTMNLYLIHSFYLGENLRELEIHAHRFDYLLKGSNQKSIYHSNLIIRQTLYNLLHPSEEAHILQGDIYNREKLLKRHLKAKHFETSFTVYQMELVLCFLFEKYEYAMSILPDIEKTIPSVEGTINIPLYYYYRSLNELAYLEEKNFQTHEKVSLKPYLKKIEARQKKLKKWSKSAPSNFLHKYYLVEAEYNHLTGNEDKARTYFDQAISLAKKNRYLNDEAIAWESAGKFYVKINQKSLAEIYIQKAVKAYQLWGISEKIKKLEEKYPKFVRRVLKQPLNKKEKVSIQRNPKMMNILEEARKISSFSTPKELWENVIRFFLKESRAEKAYILLVQDDKIMVELGYLKDEENLHEFPDTPIELFHDLANEIAIFCQKSQDTLIVDDPARNHQYVNDEYVQNYQPKSVLCFPVRQDEQVKAIIYLENNQEIAAFHEDKIENLKMLLPFIEQVLSR